MTLIECFTGAHIDNITECLRLRPEKLILVGKADDMDAPARRYKNLLAQRGQRTEISLCDVRGKNLIDICAVLDRMVEQEDDCVIDLTGGDSLVVMAFGAVLARSDPGTRQRIRVRSFGRDTDVGLGPVDDDRGLPQDPVGLTVEELIGLHGGTLHPDTYQPPRDASCQSIAGVWDIVSEAPKDWNRAITMLSEFESRSDHKTQVYLPLEPLRGSISNFRMKEDTVRVLLGKLHRKGVIDDRSRHDALEYTYNSPMLRYCTLKAGNVLEMKTLLEGRAVLENGRPYFHDHQMSVSIDWDGVLHDPMDRVPETRNEIDVVLMHGTTPLFISCKNGNIGEEELYKLHTVADRFGGPYARKMLIATDLDRKSPAANRAFIQRAWDMDIFLVTDAAELSGEEWQRIFKKAMQ